MNAMVKKNMNTLHEMYMEHTDNMQGLTCENNYLVFGNEKVDISNFDISTLFDSENPFGDSLDQLSPEDIFRIIKIHAKLTNTAIFKTEKSSSQNKKDDNERLENIKRENPLMKSVTIIDKLTEFGVKQYFNIVDSTGKDNLFYNDLNIDIFGIYDFLKIKKGNQNVTPEDLIDAIRRKLYDVELINSNHSDVDLLDKDFKNKIMYQDELHKGDKSINVYGNQEHDITLINDNRSISDHQVLTYENNEFGDVVSTTHNQNVSGAQIVNKNNETVMESNGINEKQSTTSDIMSTDENNEKEIEAVLIPIEEFYRIVNTEVEMDDNMRHSINLWYSFFQELVIYEDFLNPELKTILNDYRRFVEQLQLSDITLNDNQVEACDNLVLFEAKKQEISIGNDGIEKVQQLQYVLKKKPDNNAAFISYAQVIAIIFAMAAILTALAIYVIR